MLKCKTWNHKLSSRKRRHHAFWHWSSKYLFSYIFLGQRNKKINKCDYINLKRICTVKEITRKQNVCLLNEKRYLQTVYQISDYIQNVTGTHTIQHQTKQNKQTQLKNNLRIRTDLLPKKTYIRLMGILKKKMLNLSNH